MAVIRVCNFVFFLVYETFNRATSVDKYTEAFFGTFSKSDRCYTELKPSMIYFMQPSCKENKFSCFILIFDDYKIMLYSEIDDIYTYIIRSTVISL